MVGDEGYEWEERGHVENVHSTGRDKVIDDHYVISGKNGIGLDVERVLHSIEGVQKRVWAWVQCDLDEQNRIPSDTSQ